MTSTPTTLRDFAKGDAVRLPSGENALIRFPLTHPLSGPSHTAVALTGGTRMLSPDTPATRLLPEQTDACCTVTITREEYDELRQEAIWLNELYFAGETRLPQDRPTFDEGWRIAHTQSATHTAERLVDLGRAERHPTHLDHYRLLPKSPSAVNPSDPASGGGGGE